MGNTFMHSGMNFIKVIEYNCLKAASIYSRLLSFLDSGIKCGPPIPILNVQMLVSDHGYFGSTVKYTCQFGYAVTEGNLVRTCGEDGNWDGNIPTCSGIFSLYSVE